MTLTLPEGAEGYDAAKQNALAMECEEWKVLAIFLRGSLSGLLVDLTAGFNVSGPKAHRRAIEEAVGDDLYAGEQIAKLRATRNALAQVS